MQYRHLGRSNLKVSALCLGTMMFADQTELSAARDIMASAIDHGINFLDTADVYSNGGSESMLGKLLERSRNDWVLATKLGNRMGPGPNQLGCSRRWIMQAVDASLDRLGTDFIDILYLHRDFPKLDFVETARALADLVTQGKIRAFGLSNFRGWRIAEFVRTCEKINAPQPIVCQPYYNLLNRGPEVEILSACNHYGIGVVPYSPIARGVLTGKYVPGAAAPEGSRVARGDRRIMDTEFREESLAIARQLQEHCRGRGIELSQFATAWVLANRAVSSVIVGPRTLEQMEAYYPALEVEITAEVEALVDSLVAPGHPSTPGFTDPGHPIHGRMLS